MQNVPAFLMTTLLLLGGIATAKNPELQKSLTLDIASQPLGDALSEFGRQSGLQVVLYSDAGEGIIAPRVEGRLTAREALEKLLAGTGLEFEFLNEMGVAVRGGKTDARHETSSVAGDASVRLSQEAGGATQETERQEIPKSAGNTEAGKLEEIVVTAQKRVERLQDVPVPVTAVSADTLVTSNQRRLQDYFSTIPGLNLTLGARQESTISIRGITTYAGNPTVGIMVDDVPYGTATEAAGGYIVPDLDPGDLERIEVLRGPQGTLYGANSMGGLLKYVTVDPSTAGFSGRLQGGFSSVKNGDGLGYNLRGSVNIPLGDTFAVRASGFTRREAAYIDNTATGVEGVNELNVHGGRLATMWQPSENLSLKLSALLQKSERDGAPTFTVGTGLGDFEQDSLRGTGRSAVDTQAFSLVMDGKLGRTDIVSVTGYNVNKVFNSSDFTDLAFFRSLAESNFQVSGVAITEHKKTKKFTQELRLTTALGERVDWLLGAYYADEHSPAGASALGIDPATGTAAGAIYNNTAPTAYEEYAAFTNLTFHITDRVDIQVGGRQSYQRQVLGESTLSGPFNAAIGRADPFTTPGSRSKDDAFTFLLTPQYKLAPNLMVYARFASGYRAGGGLANPGPNETCVINNYPCAFDPDQTYNYEVGLKGDFLEHRLMVDTSAYYIDWKDVQISAIAAGIFQYTSNAGGAESKGVELSVEARPLTGLKFSGWVAWNDATFTEFPPASPIVAGPGDRLPFSSRFSGYLSVDQQFPLTAELTGSIGGSVRYVGDRKGQLGGFVVRQNYPAYAQTDLRAGASWDTWEANLFVNNVTDRRGLLSGGIGFFIADSFSYIQPRTVGLSVTKTFE
jgi:outer membrane receptor protein involved in Fe transport